jgi:hypothetical protein
MEQMETAQPGQTGTAARSAGRIHHRQTDIAEGGIFYWIAQLDFLQPNHIAELTGRNIVSVRARLRQLWKAGYLNRTTSIDEREVSYFDPPSWVYFNDKKGAELCVKLGWLEEASWTPNKSRLMLPHDLELIQLFFILRRAYGKRLTFWESRRRELIDYVKIGREQHQIIPDCIFTLDDEKTFVVEKIESAESEYENGESNVMRKARYLYHYREQFEKSWGIGDFRPLLLLPTQLRVQKLSEKLVSLYPPKVFWLVDTTSYKKDIRGRIFKTPASVVCAQCTNVKSFCSGRDKNTKHEFKNAEPLWALTSSTPNNEKLD